MTSMSRTATRPFPIGKAAGGIAARMIAGLAVIAGRGQERLQRARGAGALRALSDEQLRDIGVDRAAIEPPRPVIEVDAALMRRLMSIR